MSSRLQMIIQNPAKHLRWNVYEKKFKAFSHWLSYMFDRGLNVPLDYLICFSVAPRMLHGKVDISQTDCSIHSKLIIFSLFWSHTWKYNIQVNEGLIDVFVISFIFISMSQKVSAINKSGACYFLHASN